MNIRQETIDEVLEMRERGEEQDRAREEREEPVRRALCDVLDRLGADGTCAFLNEDPPDVLADGILQHVRGLEDRGRAEERANLVAWLRGKERAYGRIAEGQPRGRHRAVTTAFAGACRLIADDLETYVARVDAEFPACDALCPPPGLAEGARCHVIGPHMLHEAKREFTTGWPDHLTRGRAK